MKFGCSTMFFGDRDVVSSLEGIAAAGYDAAEVWMEHLWKRGEDVDGVAARAGELGLALTVHAPFYDLNMLSVNAGIRRESLDQIRAALDAAGRMGSAVVVVHPGRPSTSRDRPEEVWDRFLDCVGTLSSWSGGITVAVEMMEAKYREFFLLPEDAGRLMDQGLANVRLTVDIAHLRSHGDPVVLLRQLEPVWIGHVHLSQSLPGRTHAPLGEGDIDLPAVLAALDRFYAGIVSLEGFEPGRGEELVRANRDYLRTLGY